MRQPSPIGRGLALTILLQLCIIDYVRGFLSSPTSTTTTTTGLLSLDLKLHGRRTQQRRQLSLQAVAGADIDQETTDEAPQVVGDKIVYRGKVNEIDYCIAPADVSLSRAYGQQQQQQQQLEKEEPKAAVMSLTQALNNASNRAVRRILLAKCWPSEEALNKSLRLAAAAEKQARENAARNSAAGDARCPVPRPILNLLMRKGSPSDDNSKSSNNNKSGGGGDNNANIGGPYTTGASSPPPSSAQLKKTRTNEEYVADQIVAFRERYGSLDGYDYAEAYLQSILRLATAGKESSRVKDVLESGVYDESYRRVMSVLKSVGVILDELPGTDRFQIANKLMDQNFCLSVIDILNIEKKTHTSSPPSMPPAESLAIEEEENSGNTTDAASLEVVKEDSNKSTQKKNPLQFWKRNPVNEDDSPEKDDGSTTDVADEKKKKQEQPADIIETSTPTGGVVLCADEPTMTRQLNSISNIVHRGLLYGGDQELLVLSETLADNCVTFTNRWYPNTGPPSENMEEETRPGLQYLNSLICLLRQAYDDGEVTNLDPLVPLSQSYANSYERLLASLVEMGSGYVRPEPVEDILSMPKPRNAQEELGRFAVWETAFRSKGDETTPYPDDLEGTWEVRDEVSGETIGTSKVKFLPSGDVSVDPPLQGLRWRLDPGPTHLDTCTFQVLSEDGMILQYRGFIDRGARLEARFSKRPTKIRGSVMFQMRYGGSSNYWKDMMPVNYKAGGTKFVMTKRQEGDEVPSIWKNV